MEQHVYIFIGPQGSGKGTQAGLLKEAFPTVFPEKALLHFETGAGFRALIQNGGHTNDLVRQTIDDGKLQPPFLASWLWSSFFIEKLTGKEDVIVDGSPRSLTEATAFDSALTFYNLTPVVVYITLSEEESLKRLLARGRSDDSEDAIKERLRLFKQDTQPLLDFFAQKAYRVVEINGDQSIEAVHADIVSQITT